MTIIEALKGISPYPISLMKIEEVAIKRGLKLQQEYTREVALSADYLLALADLYVWLSVVPNISQGGQNYNFSQDERTQYKRKAEHLYLRYGSEQEKSGNRSIYGYKGSKL